MAKREAVNTKNNASRSKKTKKRMEIKHQKLARLAARVKKGSRSKK